MRITLTILLCLVYANLFSQTDDLPFHIYLVEPKAKCISAKQLSSVIKLRITDTTMTITEFLCSYFSTKDTLLLENKCAEFQAKFLQRFKAAKDGDRIYITGVKVILQDGKYTRMLAEQIELKVGCIKQAE